MTQAQILDLLMLLSALESWGLSSKQPLPDYLANRLDSNIQVLREQLLGKPDE